MPQGPAVGMANPRNPGGQAHEVGHAGAMLEDAPKQHLLPEGPPPFGQPAMTGLDVDRRRGHLGGADRLAAPAQKAVVQTLAVGSASGSVPASAMRINRLRPRATWLSTWSTW